TVNTRPMYVEREIDGNIVEIALQYQNTAFTEHVLAFANNVHTEEGGSHVTGFRSALTATLNKYARKANILKEQDPNLTGDDVRDGLTAVISVKLRDCSEREPSQCEIFIGEGDSAGGSAKGARERRNQAILPLRGKILNVEKARADKILSNEEIKNLITALGAGFGENLNVEKLR